MVEIGIVSVCGNTMCYRISTIAKLRYRFWKEPNRTTRISTVAKWEIMVQGEPWGLHGFFSTFRLACSNLRQENEEVWRCSSLSSICWDYVLNMKCSDWCPVGVCRMESESSFTVLVWIFLEFYKVSRTRLQTFYQWCTIVHPLWVIFCKVG